MFSHMIDRQTIENMSVIFSEGFVNRLSDTDALHFT